jgi:RNA-directed DNA polymerase
VTIEDKARKRSGAPEKTRIIDLNEGTEGFELLGFHHRMVKSWRYGRWYCQKWPGKRAVAGIHAKIKAVTAPRSCLKLRIEVLV